MDGPHCGVVSVASSDFTITLDQDAQAGGVSCTITDTESGDTITSTPVVIAEGQRTGTFTITPGTTPGVRTITLASALTYTSQSLDVTGQQISYNSVAIGGVTSYRISFPSPPVGNIDVASRNFTAILGDGTLGTGVSVDITPDDSSDGDFDPTTVTLSDSTPTATFTYTPGSSGAKSISAGNVLSTSGMLNDPLPVDTYTVNPIPTCTGYTFTGPITAPIGEDSGLFAITPTGEPTLQSDGTYSTKAKFTGTITITDSRGGDPVEYDFDDSSDPQTFRITATGDPGDTFELEPAWQSGDVELDDPPALTVTAQEYQAVTTTGNLGTSNTYYRLMQDVTADGTAFVIPSSNITFDLNGYNVKYDNASPIVVPNGGFESGDFTSWDISGTSCDPTVVSATQGFWGHKMAHLVYSSYLSPTTQVLKSSAIDIPTTGVPYVAFVQTNEDMGRGLATIKVHNQSNDDLIAACDPWTPHSGGPTFVKFTPEVEQVYIKIILEPSGPTDAVSDIPFVVLDGDINSTTQLAFGNLDESIYPEDKSFYNVPFALIASSVTPTSSTLTIKLSGGGGDSSHWIFADCAVIQRVSNNDIAYVDSDNTGFGSVDNSTTWQRSTAWETTVGKNYYWLAGGGTGNQYCYWTFTNITPDVAYDVYLSYPTAYWSTLNLDYVCVTRVGNNPLINGVQTDKDNICITSSASTGSGASAGAITIDETGAITSIAVGNPGSGYTRVPLVFIANGADSDYGSGATAIATIDSGQVTGFTIVSGGSAYTSAVVDIVSSGAIVQGQAKSLDANPIYCSGCENLQIDNVGVHACGPDASLIYLEYCFNVNVLNNHLVSTVNILINRMLAHGFVQDHDGDPGTRLYENNVLVGQHQGGLNIGATTSTDGIIVKYNRVYQNSSWTDGYSIGFQNHNNFEIAYNTLMPLSGRGILFQGSELQGINNGTVHDNYVEVIERGNLDFGKGMTATAFRLRNGNARFGNFSVYNNIFYARTGRQEQDFQACGVRFMMCDNSDRCVNSGVVFENNLIKAIISDYDPTLSGQDAFAVDISGYPPDLGFILRNNVIESNDTSLNFGSNDSNGQILEGDKGEHDISLISNTFKKSNDGLSEVRSGFERRTRSHKSVRVGPFGFAATDIRLIDIKYANRAEVIDGDPDGLIIYGNSLNNISTGWLLDVTVYMLDGVTPADGAIVTVTDANSNQKEYTATNGVVTGIEVLTTTYKLHTYLENVENRPYVSRYSIPNNPFTIEATLDTKSATPVTRSFTENDTVTLTLTT